MGVVSGGPRHVTSTTSRRFHLQVEGLDTSRRCRLPRYNAFSGHMVIRRRVFTSTIQSVPSTSEKFIHRQHVLDTSTLWHISTRDLRGQRVSWGVCFVTKQNLGWWGFIGSLDLPSWIVRVWQQWITRGGLVGDKWSERNPIVPFNHWFQKLESMVKMVQWDFSLITGGIRDQFS
jgi:hypothetical protein